MDRIDRLYALVEDLRAAGPRARTTFLVADVDATCTDAEQLGGSVVSKHLDPGPGAPTFAYLRDPAGHQFGVFTPPAA